MTVPQRSLFIGHILKLRHINFGWSDSFALLKIPRAADYSRKYGQDKPYFGTKLFSHRLLLRWQDFFRPRRFGRGSDLFGRRSGRIFLGNNRGCESNCGVNIFLAVWTKLFLWTLMMKTKQEKASKKKQPSRWGTIFPPKIYYRQI